MEGNRQKTVRLLQRRFECHRLEEQLLTMAYEHISRWSRAAKDGGERQPKRRTGGRKTQIAMRA